MGCCGDRELAAERTLSVPKKSFTAKPKRKVVPRDTVMVIFTAADDSVVGPATGTSYGFTRKGDVFRIKEADFKMDKRFVRCNQDTMRLFS